MDWCGSYDYRGTQTEICGILDLIAGENIRWWVEDVHKNQCCVVKKKNLHLQNTNSFLSPCALLQLFCSIRSMTLTSRNHNFESKYEAEFWCIRQVFLQSGENLQKMKIIGSLRDNLVQIPVVTAKIFAYITLFPHRLLFFVFPLPKDLPLVSFGSLQAGRAQSEICYCTTIWAS